MFVKVPILGYSIVVIKFVTCLNSVKCTLQNSIVFRCYSEVGKIGGEQKISVGSECRWKGFSNLPNKFFM